ncbi:hypothetical protein niasHS_002099 [Heterodera schachtii]|uniref:Phosphodiesterase n=1 Tax=Heterodera schachtii TaxID=97005 RepID=A0ABD2K603_HETSC
MAFANDLVVREYGRPRRQPWSWWWCWCCRSPCCIAADDCCSSCDSERGDCCGGDFGAGRATKTGDKGTQRQRLLRRHRHRDTGDSRAVVADTAVVVATMPSSQSLSSSAATAAETTASNNDNSNSKKKSLRERLRHPDLHLGSLFTSGKSGGGFGAFRRATLSSGCSDGGKAARRQHHHAVAAAANSRHATASTTVAEESPPPPLAGGCGDDTQSLLSSVDLNKSEEQPYHHQQQVPSSSSSYQPAPVPTRGRLQPSVSVSCSTGAGAVSGSSYNYHTHLGGLGAHGRRESFLYRAGGFGMADDTSPVLVLRDYATVSGCGNSGGGLPRPASRASSVASSELTTAPMHGDDFIVTPFAQLLASLRNVRANLVAIANLPQQCTALAPDDGTAIATINAGGATSSANMNNVIQRCASGGGTGTAPAAPTTTTTAPVVRPTRRSGGSSMPVWPPGSEPLPEPVQQCALETLDELDWCLDQVKSFRTSLTEMASSKFRKLLNRELSLFAGSSKAGPQISKFLLNTYMAQQPEDELATIEEKHSMLEEDPQRPSTSSPSPIPQQQQPLPSPSLFNKAKTAAVMGMSRISGVQRLRNSQSVPSEFGVPCKKEIEVYMQRINEWGLNIFKIHELSKQHSLTTVTYTLLRKRKLMFKFDINPGTLVNFLLHLEHNYRNNPYHNQIHGADVAQSMGVLISTPALEGVFSDLEVLAAIIAAAIHDVDHPGFTNQYLINTNNELAIMYNDESVLEQHHLAVAFKLLQERDCDFLAGVSKKQRQTFRKMVIEMVLATDMSKHMTLLADLKTMVEAKKVSGTDTLLDKYQDRILVLRSAIHLADLSNPTKPIELYRQWNERILEEYLRQGDREKQLGLEISPMCDRGNVTVEKSQIGFIDFIVHPLYETWAELVNPDANAILDQLEDNRQWYMTRLEEMEDEEEGSESEDTGDKQRQQQQQQQQLLLEKPFPKSASLLISSGQSTPQRSSGKPSAPGTPKMV